jgi:hypothetical protein
VAAVVLTALGLILAGLVHQLTFLNTWARIPVFPGYAGAGVVIARRHLSLDIDSRPAQGRRPGPGGSP